VRNGTCEAIKLPDYDGIETAFVAVNHQAIKFGTLLFGARDPDVYIFAHNLPPTPLAVLSKLTGLHRRILAVVGRRHACVESNSDHWGTGDSFR
jgi:hypothetical protein